MTGFRDLARLEREYLHLETELGKLCAKYLTLSNEYGQLCSVALRISLQSLVQLITYANKADTTLVKWHDNSNGAKTVLRFLNVDRKTQAAVEKKNEKIRQKINEVGSKLDATLETFTSALNSIQFLSHDMIDLSVQSVHEVSERAKATSCSLDRDSELNKTEIISRREIYSQAQEDHSEILNAVRQSNSEVTAATTSLLVRVGTTAVTGAAAGASVAAAFTFLPALLVTAPLAYASYRSAAALSETTQQVMALRSKTRELELAAAEPLAKISAIEDQLSRLNRRAKTIASSKAQSETYQTKAGAIRAEAQAILDNIRAAKIMLSDVMAKLKAIAQQLRDCEDAETRRELGAKIRSTLKLLALTEVKRRTKLTEADVQKVTRSWVDLDEKTPEIMKVIHAQVNWDQDSTFAAG